MSHLLDSVLDPARRAAVAANDRALRLAARRPVAGDPVRAADRITEAVQALRCATLALQRGDLSHAEDFMAEARASIADALDEVQA